jgi:5'-3' exonuclease
MRVHLVDGTYELFRHYYALPSHVNAAGQEVAATRGVVRSMLSMLGEGATHVAVATDHVVESFRNELWEDYKEGSGIEPELFSQFGLLEDALRALGLPVWAMVEHEADDGLAAGAALAAADGRVEQVLICTPDKDLAQCVVKDHVVQLDRRKRVIIDEDGVVKKYGVPPASIPDYLALVGDDADGFPGVPGWGAKTSATVLARYGHIEEIPESAEEWDVNVRGAARAASALKENRELAFLFRQLATLDVGAPVSASVDELEWTGPDETFLEVCAALDAPELVRVAEGVGGFGESRLGGRLRD